jgi:general secretion pathway protein K
VKTRQRGVALLQVLFLSAILGVLMLSIQQMAKQHVATAQAVINRVETQLALDSVDAKLKFNLLTTDLTNNYFVSLTSVKMNLFDQPFTIDNAEIRIQDISGLISIADYVGMELLLAHFSRSPRQAQMIAAAIQDWEDMDDDALVVGAEQRDYPADVRVRNQPIQFEDELKAVRGMTSELYHAIRPYITLYPINFNNAMLMPPKLMELYVEPQLARQLVAMRQIGGLTSAEFDRVSGLSESEQFVNSASPAQRVTFTIVQNNVKLQRQYVIRLSPYQTEPFSYWEYLSNLHADNF